MSETKDIVSTREATGEGNSVFQKNLQSVRQYFQSIFKKNELLPGTIIRGRIALLLCIQTLGLFFLIIALSIPDLVLVSQRQATIFTRRGFFIQCTTFSFRPQQEPVCERGTLQELGAPVALYFITLFSSLAAYMKGLRFVFWTSDQRAGLDGVRMLFQQTHLLFLMAGLSSFCGVISFTYIYGEFTRPVLPGFVLLWLVGIILAVSAFLPYFFKDPIKASSKQNAVAPTSVVLDVEPGPST